MRATRLAYAALTSIAVSIPATAMTGMTGLTAAAANAAVSAGQHKAAANAVTGYESFDQKAATYVKSLEGVPYVYGGTTPAGFDCSGLTQYVYQRFGRRIARTAEEQFLQFRPISKARAWGGDLVFFHVDSDPDSYVYHVGIYEGGDSMVAATAAGGAVAWQSFAWAGDTVTFGTVTH